MYQFLTTLFPFGGYHKTAIKILKSLYGSRFPAFASKHKLTNWILLKTIHSLVMLRWSSASFKCEKTILISKRMV